MPKKRIKEEIPTSLTVGPITYKIVEQELDDLHGDTNMTDKIIRINKGDNLDVKRETLFHEILHVAMEDMAYLKFTYADKSDQEEDIIRYISPRLVDMIQRNPVVFNFVQGDRK